MYDALSEPMGSIKYDDVDYHVDAAVAAGQPPENAFTHMGLFLAWLVRHELHNPEFIPSSLTEQLNAGEITGPDLVNVVDGKLTSDLMAADGKAFSDAYYRMYLEDYGRTFADLPDYAVTDDASSYERIAAVLDGRYREWIEAGRPPPDPAPPELDPDFADFRPGTIVTSVEVPGLGPEELRIHEEFLRDMAGEGWTIERPLAVEEPHEALDLERLIPAELTHPPMSVSSVSAARFGDPLLRRVLDRLGVPADRAMVASALGGGGERTGTVRIIAVPGVDAARLAEAFGRVAPLPPGGRWEGRKVGGKRVRLGVATEFTVATWTRNGLVMTASSSGDMSLLEALIAGLP